MTLSEFPFPALNAFLNATASILLTLGWISIRQKRIQAHRNFMISAVIASFLFLCSYLTYHLFVHGVTHYQEEGFIRIVYFFILLTHTPLATLIVPFILMALWYAYKQDFVRHVRITRWLLPVWLYVSVTGVVIYLMLYIF
jgi:putative membrane protein